MAASPMRRARAPTRPSWALFAPTRAFSLAVVAAGVWRLVHLARSVAPLLVANGAGAALVRAYARHGKDHVSVAAPVCAALARRLRAGDGGGGGTADAAVSPALARTCRTKGWGGCS